MNAFLIALLLQSSLLLPPRSAMENPAAVSPIPARMQRVYDSLWARFVAGDEDAKLVRDLDILIRKQKDFDPAITLAAYIDLYKGDDTNARQKFEQALALNANHRIALYYLAELAYAHNEYARASSLYAQLLSIDASRPELQTKRQRALLLATEDLLRSAARAEAENRLAESDLYYRQALAIVPKDPTLHAQLANVLAKENKKGDADAERKIVEELTPRHVEAARSKGEIKGDDLEDLGRWGKDIDRFHQIKSAEMITREQLATVIVRYFPQLTELPQTPEIVTDIQDSWAGSDIQTVVGLGLVELLPNHTFEPSTMVTRGDLPTTLAHLSHLLGLTPPSTPPVAAADLAESNANYSDIQLVLGYGVMTLEDSGSFNADGVVSGRDAVHSLERLLAIFQQTAH